MSYPSQLSLHSHIIHESCKKRKNWKTLFEMFTLFSFKCCHVDFAFNGYYFLSSNIPFSACIWGREVTRAAGKCSVCGWFFHRLFSLMMKIEKKLLTTTKILFNILKRRRKKLETTEIHKNQHKIINFIRRVAALPLCWELVGGWSERMRL